ncbi:membrane protein [Arthrobacter phage Vibaki]|uniref:Membrane protein n=1 Tax=Arthrobacter phage Vibaki TaxID=2593333 RepID=A0A514TYY8_9CAUD|nr:membrane protein [Arthrobacter phage Vibaki]QDK01906.1 membrane protein [Arthrobacter phage Vibaki]
MTRRIPRTNGRRGAFQIVMGVVYLVVGSSFFFLPATPSREVTFAWLTAHIPLGWFAALWIIAAAAALVCAFLPRPRDAAGFVSLVAAPGIWAVLFFLSAAINDSPFTAVSGVIYGAFGVLPLIVAGMSGPKDRDLRGAVK